MEYNLTEHTWTIMKVGLRVLCTTVMPTFKARGIFANNLMMSLKVLQKEEQIKLNPADERKNSKNRI